MPGLVNSSQRSQFIAGIEGLQQPNGGCSPASLDGRRSLKSQALDVFRRVDRLDGSDGCGTGLAVLAIAQPPWQCRHS